VTPKAVTPCTLSSEGSSGSRVHVFSLLPRGAARGALPVVRAEEGVLKVKPGLSSFEGDPAGAGASLAPLFAFAQQCVPPDDLARTPIVLLATAGLRTVERGTPKTLNPKP